MGKRSVLQGEPRPIQVQCQYWDGETLVFQVRASQGAFAPDDVVCVPHHNPSRGLEDVAWLGQVRSVAWDQTHSEEGVGLDQVTVFALWGTLPETGMTEITVYRWDNLWCERFVATLASQYDGAGHADVVHVGEHVLGHAGLLAQTVTGIQGDSVGGKQVLVAALAQQLCQHGVWVLDPTGRYTVPNEKVYRFTGEHGISLKDVGWVTLANYLGHQFPAELRKPLWDWLAQVVPDIQDKPFWTLQDLTEHARQHHAMPLIEADLNRVAAYRVFASAPSQVLPINQAAANANQVHRLDLSHIPKLWRALVVDWTFKVWLRHAQAQDKKPYIVVIQPELMGKEVLERLSELRAVGFGLALVSNNNELDAWRAMNPLDQLFTASHRWLLETMDDEAVFEQPHADQPYDVHFYCQGQASGGLPIQWDVPASQLVVHGVEPCEWSVYSGHLPVRSEPSKRLLPKKSEEKIDVKPSSPLLKTQQTPRELSEPTLSEMMSHHAESTSEEFKSNHSSGSEEWGMTAAEKENRYPQKEVAKAPQPSRHVAPYGETSLDMGLDDLQEALETIDLADESDEREAMAGGMAVMSRDSGPADIDPTPQPAPARQRSSRVTSRSPERGGSSFEVGDRVRHQRYGEGTVDRLIPTGKRMTVRVMFDDSGKRLLDADRSALELL